MITTRMQTAAAPLIEKIIQLPFNQQLMQGSLASHIFHYYMVQDTLYLADYARALAFTAARLTNHDHRQQFMIFCATTITEERQLHTTYLQQHALLTIPVEQTPICFMYTNYLLNLASSAPVEVAVASLLPCFWVYQQVAQALQRNLACNNPYAAWIKLYVSDAFAQSVTTAVRITNELGSNTSAAIQQNMLQAFLRATQLEWLFWDSAYHQESWRI